jgi:hypothetical protein
MFFKTVAPATTIMHEGTAHQVERQDHDAFGQISVQHATFNRGGLRLFGSEIDHQNVVHIKLKRAYQNRRHYQNEAVEDDTVAEFYMSEAQWARFVSGPGTGLGTPVTFRMAPVRGTDAIGMPGIEAETMQRQMADDIQKKFASYMQDANEIMAEMQRMSEKSSISKTEFRELQKKMSVLSEGLPNTFSFMHEQFHESMNDAAHQVMAEVDAFVSNVVNQTGLEFLKNGGAPSISFSKKDGESQ